MKKPLLALLLLVFAVAIPSAAERPGYVTILHYQWYEDPWMGTSATPMETFREQMAHLKQGGYRVVPLQVLKRMHASGEPLLSKLVAIAIEGSSRAIYDEVYPILKTYGYPSVLFPFVKALDIHMANLMTWEMVETLYASGVDIGILPYSNTHLGHPEPGQNQTEYRFHIRSEILNAQRALNLHGIETDLFAFPFGDYNVHLIEEARALGCRLMFTRDRGSMDARTHPTLIPRIVIAAAMTLDRFVFNLNLAPLHVADVYPEPGFLQENPPRAFSLRLVTPQRYRPGVVNMFISELGNVEAHYDAAAGTMTYRPDRTLTRERNHLTITARELDNEHYSIFSRLYLQPIATWRSR